MKTYSKNGFTLVEMAIVLFIMSLIIGSGLTLLSAQQEQIKKEDSTVRLNEIREALLGFVVANGRLPCPTQANLATGQPNAGLEAFTAGNTCTCQSTTGPSNTIADLSASKVPCVNTTVTGVLPWATLGISEKDAWGRRPTYRVTRTYANAIDNTRTNYGLDSTAFITCGANTVCLSPNGTHNSSFALCSCGELNILSATSGGSTIATNIPAVVVSHGENGLGAYLPTGQQVLPVPAANTDEVENANNDSNFVSHSLVRAADGVSGIEFDDQITWISPNILFNRMVQAGRLP